MSDLAIAMGSWCLIMSAKAVKWVVELSDGWSAALVVAYFRSVTAAKRALQAILTICRKQLGRKSEK